MLLNREVHHGFLFPIIILYSTLSSGWYSGYYAKQVNLQKPHIYIFLALFLYGPTAVKLVTKLPEILMEDLTIMYLC